MFKFYYFKLGYCD
uniref:Uncharacterized protein n=1 Tax=Anguilla anguilla TaxID=7936 RepID=A0A0E9VIH9_ANGAN